MHVLSFLGIRRGSPLRPAAAAPCVTPGPARRCARPGLLPLIGFLLLLPSCSDRNAGGRSESAGKEAVPVHVAVAIRRTIPIEIEAIGTVEAFSTVSVKSQLAGEVAEVHFKEGQDVRAGDLLFTIDPRPFRAQLAQAEANLRKDEAQARNARVDANRYEGLVKQGIVARERYDALRTEAEAQEATVAADRAAMNETKLRLDYCFIRSPIDGRTGSLLVHPGNVVKENETVMVVINQVSPIRVSFAVPEQRMPEIRKYRDAGTLEILATPPGEGQDPEEGSLSFMDNAVDSATGTIRLKGSFPNGDRRLWPGQFVKVALTLTKRPDAVLVPSEAVQPGQQGSYVFVIGRGDVAEVRQVTPGPTLDGNTVMEAGVREGDRVVTDGQLRLAAGVHVRVEAAPPGGGKGPR